MIKSIVFLIFCVIPPIMILAQSEFQMEIDHRYELINDFDWDKKLLSAEHIDCKKCEVQKALQNGELIIIPNYYFSADKVSKEDLLELKRLSLLDYTVYLIKGSKIILELYGYNFNDTIKCSKNKIDQAEEYILKNRENSLFSIEGIGAGQTFLYFDESMLKVQDFSGNFFLGINSEMYNRNYRYSDFISERPIDSQLKIIADFHCQRLYGLGADECY